MTGWGRALAAGAAALVLALAGACSSAAEPAAPPTPAPALAGWPGCEAVGAFDDDAYPGDASHPTGSVPAGFTPVSVVLCGQGERTDARGDTVGVDLERTSTQAGSLLTYLAQPSERPSDGPCTADGWIPPWLFLVDASGRYVAPAVPVDGCAKPLGWSSDREHLPWTTLPYTERVLRERGVVESALARRTGCEMGYKDVINDFATSSHARSGEFGKDPFTKQALRVCVFEVPAAERSVEPPGELVAGHELDGHDRAAVVAALVAAPSTRARCTTEVTRFATLTTTERSATVYVELDGCRRVVSDGQPTPVVRATDDLIALLGG